MPACGGEHGAEIVEHLDGEGFDFQGALVSVDRFIRAALILEGIAEIEVGGGEVGLDLDGMAKCGDGFVPSSALGESQPEVVPRVQVTRLHREDLLIKRFCLHEMTSSMVLQSEVKGLWDSEDGHRGFGIEEDTR